MGVYKQGFVFAKFQKEKQDPFDQLFTIFKELITHTSGDFDEAIDWLRELDKEYQLISPEYTIEDFIEDLKKRGYIREEFEDGAGDGSGDGSSLVMAAKLEQALRKNALEQIFGKLKKSQKGNHSTNKGGISDDASGDFRGYAFGDAIEQISLTESFAMYPAASVSGWYFAHPDARYFGVGRIGKDQVESLASRKSMDLKVLEKWLSVNVNYEV